MQDARLSSHDELLDLRMRLGIFQHCGSGAFHVCDGQHRSLALQMRHHHGMRMLLLEFHNAIDRELLMDMAATIPQEHVAPRDAVDIVAKVIIWPKDDFASFGKLAITFSALPEVTTQSVSALTAAVVLT